MTYQRGKRLYEGKSSELYEAADECGQAIPYYLIINRKDDITKLDGEVRSSIEGKGAYTNRISNCLFRVLEEEGIPTHLVQELSAHETLVLRTTPLQLEVIVRNIATGSLCKRLPFEEGQILQEPIIELNLKDDAHHDPLINANHAIALGISNYAELCEIEETADFVNDVLRNFFSNIGITLVDFKLEFGRLESTGEIILIDEISPDTCRLWDTKTGQKLDKDVFRQGMGDDATLVAYREVFERLAERNQD